MAGQIPSLIPAIPNKNDAGYWKAAIRLSRISNISELACSSFAASVTPGGDLNLELSPFPSFRPQPRL